MKPIPFNALAKCLRLCHANQSLVHGIAIDSRKVKSGDLFFALPGNRVDGHRFIPEVVAKGAVGIVAHTHYQGETYGLPFLYVPDVLLALQDLARRSLEKRNSKIIAITGSIGKTTVKEFIATLMQPHYRIFASPLSYNSQVTLPLSILMADGIEEYLILEMGMTHPGQLERLVSIAPPDIALLTTVAVQHAVNFSEGLLGISREKSVVFSHPKTRVGILHYDMHNFDEVFHTGTCEKKTFSTRSMVADFYLEEIKNGVRIHAKEEPPLEVSLQLPIKVHYHNFLAAVAVAHAVGIPGSCIRDAAHCIHLPSMRFEKVTKRGILFINDAYNANPDSMKAALENLPTPESGGKTIAVLSEMDALGSYTEGGHTLVAETALQYADLLLCLGNRCETMRKIWERKNKPVELYETRQELEEAVIRHSKPGDVVLLKGARAHALDEILNRF